MKTLLPVILLSVIAIAAGFAIRATTVTRGTGTAAAALASERAKLHARVHGTEARLRIATEAGVGLEKKIAAARAARNTVEVAAARQLSNRAWVASDPKRLAAYSQVFREKLDLDQGTMFKALGLSADQIEKFKDLKVWTERGLPRNAARFGPGGTRRARSRRQQPA